MNQQSQPDCKIILNSDIPGTLDILKTLEHFKIEINAGLKKSIPSKDITARTFTLGSSEESGYHMQ